VDATDRPDPRPVPWRTIFATVGTVIVALLLLLLLRELSRVIAWLVVAGFLAVVLAPAVDWCEHRLHLRRGLATSIVFFGGLILLGRARARSATWSSATTSTRR
jgi:predicted PurR-regulated permease PerM